MRGIRYSIAVNKKKEISKEMKTLRILNGKNSYKAKTIIFRYLYNPSIQNY